MNVTVEDYHEEEEDKTLRSTEEGTLRDTEEGTPRQQTPTLFSKLSAFTKKNTKQNNTSNNNNNNNNNKKNNNKKKAKAEPEVFVIQSERSVSAAAGGSESNLAPCSERACDAPLNEDDFYEKKCLQCKQFFFGEEWTQTKCYYHPGKFSDPGQLSDHQDLGWSCCRKQCLNVWDWDGFWDMQAGIHIPSVSEIVVDQLQNLSKDYKDIIAKKYLTNQSSQRTSKTNNPNSQNNNTENPGVNETNENSFSRALLSLEKRGKDQKTPLGLAERLDQERVHKRELIMHEKTASQTYSWQERLDCRDHKDFSVFSKNSIGCTIADHHVLDTHYHRQLMHFQVQDKEAMERKRKEVRKNRPLDQELLQRKLQDNRNQLPNHLLSLPSSTAASYPQLEGPHALLQIGYGSAPLASGAQSSAPTQTNKPVAHNKDPWEGWVKVEYVPKGQSKPLTQGPIRDPVYDAELLKKVQEDMEERRQRFRAYQPPQYSEQTLIHISGEFTPCAAPSRPWQEGEGTVPSPEQPLTGLDQGKDLPSVLSPDEEKQIPPISEKRHSERETSHSKRETSHSKRETSHSEQETSQAEHNPTTWNQHTKKISVENGPDESTSQEEEEEEEEKTKETFFRHQTQDHDTLVSLSFKYDVTIDEIRSANKIGKFLPKTQSLIYYKEILIPTHGRVFDPQEVISQDSDKQIRSLALKANISLQTAKYYLEECDWDVDAALKTAQEDLKWESQVGEKKFKRSLHVPTASKPKKKSEWSIGSVFSRFVIGWIQC